MNARTFLGSVAAAPPKPLAISAAAEMPFVVIVSERNQSANECKRKSEVEGLRRLTE